MISAYMVVIKDRILQNEAQKKVPDKQLCLTHKAAQEMVARLTGDTIRFHPSQIAIYQVEIKIINEVCHHESS